MSEHGTQEAARHGIARSPHWPAVEHEHKKLEPLCLHCGKGEPDVKIQVHHGFPFHYCIALGRPDLELDHRNLHSLCECEHSNAHLLIGHADNFKSSNLLVVGDAANDLHNLSDADIRQSAVFSDRVAHRLKPLDEMSDAEKAELRQMMDARIPSKM